MATSVAGNAGPVTDKPDLGRAGARPAGLTANGFVRAEGTGQATIDPLRGLGDASPRPGNVGPVHLGADLDTTGVSGGEPSTATWGQAPADDADPAAVTTDTDAATQAPAVNRWNRWTALAGGLLAAGLVTLAVLILLASGTWRDNHARADDRAAATAAARQAAVNLTMINFATADADIQRILASGTGEFADQFTTNLDSYKDLVKQGKVVTTGEVKEAGLVSLDGKTAKVSVALSSTVKNDQTPDGEERAYRMLIEVHRQADGRWLASRVEFVQ